jgi:hypothetical protein
MIDEPTDHKGFIALHRTAAAKRFEIMRRADT